MDIIVCFFFFVLLKWPSAHLTGEGRQNVFLEILLIIMVFCFLRLLSVWCEQKPRLDSVTENDGKNKNCICDGLEGLDKAICNK